MMGKSANDGSCSAKFVVRSSGDLEMLTAIHSKER
jgi:hypothetical protein